MSKPNPLKTTITEQLEQASFIVHRGETWQDAMEATDGPNGERRGVGDMYGEFIGKKLQGLALIYFHSQNPSQQIVRQLCKYCVSVF